MTPKVAGFMAKFAEQSSSLFESRCFGARTKPAVDLGKDLFCFDFAILALKPSREGCGCLQFKVFGLLVTSALEG